MSEYLGSLRFYAVASRMLSLRLGTLILLFSHSHPRVSQIVLVNFLAPTI